MKDTILGIDKGIITAFALLVILVGSITTFFFSEYVSTVILGSVFYSATNGTTSSITSTGVVNESFVARNDTAVTLTNSPITSGTLVVYNGSSGSFGLGNFTIVYAAGNLTLATVQQIPNGTTLSANYTYTTTTITGSALPISTDANTLISNAEDDFVTVITRVNTGMKFASGLITVVAVILVFGVFLRMRKQKREGKGVHY